jgi:hypothetical protein
MSHALKSASGADTWMLCPGSVRQSRGCVDKGSSFASEGTAAHHFAEFALRTGLPTLDCVGDVHAETGIVCTDEMASQIGKYVDAIREMPGHKLYEVKLDLREWVPPSEADPEGGFGTSDTVVLTEDVVTIADLKYGMGHRVVADDNRQLRLYGLGGLRLAEAMGYEPKSVTVSVYQPRLDHFDEFAYPVRDLLAFGEEVKLAAAAADAPDAELIPGDAQCLWCKAKATCPALVGQLVATVPASPALFDDESRPSVLTPPTDLTPETLALIYPKLGMLKDWIDACHEHVHTLVAMGEFPGHKMIAGRKGNRVWTDAKQAEATMKQMKLKIEEMYELKLISPTKAEKLAESGVIGPRQWPKLQQHINRPDGKPTVVPLSDLRPALVFKAPADAFENEEI